MNATPACILIVDDNPSKLTALSAALDGMDIKIVTANSGMDALRKLLVQDFAVMLLDVNMPIMDGFDTAEIVRLRPASEFLPIIFITAERITDESRLQGYELGAVDYIFSPILPQILRAKVAVFVDLYRMRIELQERGQLVRNVIDNIADPVFLKDDLGKFVLANVAMARLNNTTPEAMIGQSADDLAMPVALAKGFLHGEQKSETQVDFVDSQNRVTGEIRHYKSIKTPMRDGHGRFQVLVVAQDITEIVRSHKQVAESEQRLSDVMNITQEAVWDWHIPSGRVLHNQQWHKVLGFQTGEIANTIDAFTSLIHQDDKPEVMQRIKALVRSETDSYQSEHRMVVPNGTIWVQDRGAVVDRDEQGQPVRVVGSFTDITERHVIKDKIAALLSEQQTILRSDVVGLVITQGRCIRWASPSLLHTLGYEWLEVEGHVTRFIFHSEEAFLAAGEAAYAVILANQVFRAPMQLRHKNGSLIWFDLAGVKFGEYTDQVLWSCVDISAQKIAEAKLIEAGQEALAATVAKSQFLATMSHEVRTPMNGILGMAQLLAFPQLQDDKRLEYAQTILDCGHMLLSLLNDILDLSKVEAGKLNLESIVFAVLPVVSDTCTLFTETAKDKGLQLESS